MKEGSRYGRVRVGAWGMRVPWVVLGEYSDEICRWICRCAVCCVCNNKLYVRNKEGFERKRKRFMHVGKYSIIGYG